MSARRRHSRGGLHIIESFLIPFVYLFNFFNLVSLLLRSCYLDSLVLGEISSGDANYTVPEQVDGEGERGATALLLPYASVPRRHANRHRSGSLLKPLCFKCLHNARAVHRGGLEAPAARRRRHVRKTRPRASMPHCVSLPHRKRARPGY